MLGYRLRHVHDSTGTGASSSGGNGGNSGGGTGGNGSGSGGNGSGSGSGGNGLGNGPITAVSASSLSQSHEEALFIRLAWQAEQTQILLGDVTPPHLSSPNI